MKKGISIAVTSIFLLIALICFFFSIMIKAQVKKVPEELIYPASGLSSSIFDAQNGKYIKVPDTTTYALPVSPFLIDLKNSYKNATVGTSIFQKVSDYTVIGFFDCLESTYLSRIVSDLVPVLVSNYDKDNIKLYNIEKNTLMTGYVNGYYCDYILMELIIGNTQNSNTRSVFLVGYLIHLEGKEIEDGRTLMILGATVNHTSNNYRLVKEAAKEYIYYLQPLVIEGREK